jgi:hypothetical protein
MPTPDFIFKMIQTLPYVWLVPQHQTEGLRKNNFTSQRVSPKRTRKEASNCVMITTNRLIEWRATAVASSAVNLRGEREHLVKKLSVEDGPAFVALMRHYVVDYTNRHDQSKAESIMEPDYLLRMGDHVVRGRDGAYRAATAKQLKQFPGLTLTVHEVVTSGERLAMRFSEHGASRTHGGGPCSWGGIGLYSWNGCRLVSNFVEQDYFSRREQLAAGRANPVESPALAPWDTAARAPDPIAESITHAWLDSGAVAATPGGLLDDQWISQRAAPLALGRRMGRVATHLSGADRRSSGGDRRQSTDRQGGGVGRTCTIQGT